VPSDTPAGPVGPAAISPPFAPSDGAPYSIAGGAIPPDAAAGIGQTPNWKTGYAQWYNTQTVPTKVVSGTVEQLLPDPSALSGFSYQALSPTDTGQQLYTASQGGGLALADKANNLANAGAGAAAAFLKTPTELQVDTPKTTEIARQFKDFLARVNEVYSTEKANQDLGFAADNQAQKDAAALNQGDNVPVSSAFAVSPTWGQPNYSAELAQSIPTSVSPDYQLNGAVGLPGQDGFAASPETGSVPSFATGTIPQSSLPSGRDMITRTQGILAKWPYGVRPMQ
jgi:hypothetical protein